jgi:hypothetical protein
MLVRVTLLLPVLLFALPHKAFSQAQKFEYAQFTVIAPIAFVWEAGDSTVLTQAPRERDVGIPDKNAPKILRQISGALVQLNHMGDEGWELVSVQSQGSTSVYLLKRRKA